LSILYWHLRWEGWGILVYIIVLYYHIYHSFYSICIIKTMSSQKTININPDLFKITSNKTRKKLGGEKKIKVKSNNATTMKKNKSMMLRRIREKQKENYRKLFENAEDTETATNSGGHNHNSIARDFPVIEEKTDFADSVAFLENIKIEEEKKKKERRGGTSSKNPYNSTIKNYRNSELENNGYYKTIKEDIQNLKSGGGVDQIFSSPVSNGYKVNSFSNHPGYGCLKGGTLPTYKTYIQNQAQNQTKKQYAGVSPRYLPTPSQPTNANIGGSITGMVTPPNIITIANPPSSTPSIGENKGGGMASLFMKNHTTPINNMYTQGNSNRVANDDKLKKISELRQMRQFLNRPNENKAPNKLKYMKRKKTLKRTHYVGKSKVHPKVSVLVSNKTIRKNVARKTEELKQTPIKEVRKYLIKNGFIRIGSTAPNDVLRKMYESASLIGGEIYNHNPENLLHNYLNENKG